MRVPPGGSDTSVGRRLTLTFGLLIALFLLIGVGTLVTSWVVVAQHNRTTQVQPVLNENLRLRDQVIRMSRAVRTYQLTGDTAARSDYIRIRGEPFVTLVEARKVATPSARRNLELQGRQLSAYSDITDQQAWAKPGSAEARRLTEEATRRFSAFDSTNQRLQARLTGDRERLENTARRFLFANSVAIGFLLTVGGAVSVFAALRTTRALTRPLQSTAATLDRLASGDHSARAAAGGPLEISAVARSVNALADESDRLRAIEQERARLAEAARDIGVRVRERLDVDHLLDAACAGIGEGLAADHAFVLLGEEDGPRARVARSWSTAGGLLRQEEQPIPPVLLDVVRDRFERGATWCLNGLPTEPAEGPTLPSAPAPPGPPGQAGLPPDARATAGRLGLVNVLLVPLGVSEQPLGAVLLARSRPDRPWREVETDAAESMASGVGRALRTALLYQRETQLVEELRALDQAKSDFLSTVSHELRTPLTSIVGYIELLEDEEAGSLTPSQQHMLGIVERNANRLRALIEDLLTLSRIESGTFGSRKEPVDLGRLVTSAADAIRPAAEAASVTVERHLPDAPLVLRADGDQLDRVLMNLLSNAVKFTPAGGKVTVRAGARDGEAVLSVSDTGIGIPAAEQRRLFQRFFRASNATEAAIPGTGLGLTIVRAIVVNHGGELEVDSEEGRGTTFTARLPIAAQTVSSNVTPRVR